MGIHLRQLRVHGFRGLDNLEIDFDSTTVLVGTNNAGKTTLLKSLQLALSNMLQITDEDFHFSDDLIRNKIVVDILFISVDDDGKRTSEFEDKWATVFTVDRIGIDADGNQFLAFRTIVEENLIRKTYKKKQYLIDEWGDFHNETEGHWYSKEYNSELSFYFDEIPFFYLDANRDILDDLKNKTSFLGKILSSINYNQEDREIIESLIQELNKESIERSDVLISLQATLEELDTAMDNPQNTVDITPFTKKIRDLNKGVKINYSQFSMEYHGMGTRSWSSLLILKAFILQNQKLADDSQVAYFPILAIEEPESHLHPNAQKKLYTQINNIVGQKLVATHSSYIAGSAKLKEIRSVIKGENSTTICKIFESDLTSEEIRKIHRQVINTRGELYFAKVIILCEGETEEQALPILIKKHLGQSTIELGIDIVGINGGGNYFPFMYFAEKLNIKWLILSDGESGIIKKLKKDFKKLTSLDRPLVEIVLPQNIVHFDNEEDFEMHLIANGFIEEIEKCLRSILNITDLQEYIANKNGTSKGRIKTDKICCTCNQNIFQEQLRNYNGEDGYLRALNDLLSQNKTQYSVVLSELIYDSDKPLPPKMVELFEKVGSILNPTNI
jgi:putative ATP-dependent endonuclease of OLD family